MGYRRVTGTKKGTSGPLPIFSAPKISIIRMSISPTMPSKKEMSNMAAMKVAIR
jgi:hypothetical protein